MMQSNRGAAQYRSVRSHGLVEGSSPTRLVQIMFEHILTNLATAQGCMGRIENNLPLSEVTRKLEMLFLILADRNQVRLVKQYVRGHQHRIVKHSHSDILALLPYLVLKLSHPLQLRHARDAI